MNKIERAEKIVGYIATPPRGSPVNDLPRRMRFYEWLDMQRKHEVKPHLPTPMPLLGISSLGDEDVARIICAIDDARKPKGDGLPPGPWSVVRGVNDMACVADSKGGGVCTGYGWTDESRHRAAYIARCGSQPVRDILAACDDAELARWAEIIRDFKAIDGTPYYDGKFEHGRLVWSKLTISVLPRPA